MRENCNPYSEHVQRRRNTHKKELSKRGERICEDNIIMGSRGSSRRRWEAHQICSLIFFPSNSMVLILKSIPSPRNGTETHTYITSPLHHTHVQYIIPRHNQCTRYSVKWPHVTRYTIYYTTHYLYYFSTTVTVIIMHYTHAEINFTATSSYFMPRALCHFCSLQEVSLFGACNQVTTC